MLSLRRLSVYVTFIASVVAVAEGGAAVPQTLSWLQAAVRKDDAAGFRRLLADPVKVSMWAKGRHQSATASAQKVTSLFLGKDKEMLNPFRSPTSITDAIVSTKSAAGGAWRVRLKFEWYMQRDLGMTRWTSQQMCWQVCDVELGPAGRGLVLRAVDFVPADVRDAIDAKLEAFIRRAGGRIDEPAVLAEQNRLVGAFVGTGKQPAPRADVVVEPNPRVERLPPNRVTRAIRTYRTQADNAVRRQFPNMANRLIVEAVERFRGRDFFMRVYQQKTVFRTFGRDFRLTKRLIFSFDPQGSMLTLIAPQLEPKDGAAVQAPQQAERPVRLAAAPKTQGARCMVLTNLAKVAQRHPQNARSIEQFLRSYGEIIDIGAARIDADDWQAVDRLVEQRFDPKTHDCLFIFGGPEVVPHGVYTNPVTRKDEPDKIIYSDDYYADFTHDDAHDWEVMVVRLPDDRGILQDANSIVNRRVPSDGRIEYPNFVVYGNCEWPVSNDMARLGNPSHPSVLMSKPTTYQTFSPGYFRNNNLFINLHGSDKDGRVFWGEEPNTPKVTAVSALHIDQAVAPGSVVFCSACYGASIRGKTSDNSIALRFLRNGARCYIGSTRVSYISTSMSRTCGLWAKLLKGYLDKGECPPRAFMLAKLDYARSGVTEPHQFKIYHEYIYLGVPPQRYKGSTPTPPPPPPPPTGKPFEVRWHRLFEGPEGDNALLQEHARQAKLIESGAMKLPTAYAFPRSTTRRVFCLVLLRNLLHHGRDHSHQSVTRFYGPTGKLVGETKDRFTMRKDNGHFLHMGSWGDSRPGTWAPGRYRVVMQFDGKTVADRQFTILDDAPGQPVTPTPSRGLLVAGLGVEVLTFTKQLAAQRSSKAGMGALITRIHPNTPASGARMGINESIVFIDSTMIRSAEQLKQRIARVRPGSTIKVIVTKPDGYGRTYDVTLGRPAAPTPPPPPDTKPKTGLIKSIGVMVKGIRTDDAKRLRLPTTLGALVHTVIPGGPAAKAGIRENDAVAYVGGDRVKSATEMVLRMAKAKPGEKLMLNVMRPGGRQHFVTLIVGGGSAPPPPDPPRPRPEPTPRSVSFPDGSKYVGEFQGNQPHGYGTFTWSNGAKYVGFFVNGNRQGWGKWFYPDGGLYAGLNKDGRPDGGTYLWANANATWARQSPNGKWDNTWPRIGNAVPVDSEQWADISKPFAAQPVVHVRMSGKRTMLTIWAAYTSRQDFTLRLYRGPRDKSGKAKPGDPGLRADLVARPRATAAEMAALRGRLSVEGAPGECLRRLAGRYAYRLVIDPRDRSSTAGYVLATVTPAEFAIGQTRPGPSRCGVATFLPKSTTEGPKPPPDDDTRTATSARKTVSATQGGTVALASGASVAVPPGALERDAVASVTASKNTLLSKDPRLKVGPTLYRIEVGGRSRFPKPLTITIPYRKADLPPGTHERSLELVRYDHDTKTWLPQGGRVDGARQVIRVATRQISLWSYVTGGDSWQQLNSTLTVPSGQQTVPRFVVHYTTTGSSACTQAYAQRILDALEKTYGFLNRLNFAIRPWQLDVHVKALGEGVTGEARYYTYDKDDKRSYLEIAPGQTSTPQLKETAAHEYWHLCQDYYFPNQAGAPSQYLWFIEATVPPITDHLYPLANGFCGGITDNSNFIRHPLTDSSRALGGNADNKAMAHGYGYATFFMYLCKNNPLSQRMPVAVIRDFWRGLAAMNPATRSRKDPIAAMVAVINGLPGSRKTFEKLFIDFTDRHWRLVDDYGGTDARGRVRWSRDSIKVRMLSSANNTRRFTFDLGNLCSDAAMFQVTNVGGKVPKSRKTLCISGGPLKANQEIHIYAGQRKGSTVSGTRLAQYGAPTIITSLPKTVTFATATALPAGHQLTSNAVLILVINGSRTEKMACSIDTEVIIAMEPKGFNPKWYGFVIEKDDLPDDWQFVKVVEDKENPERWENTDPPIITYQPWRIARRHVVCTPKALAGTLAALNGQLRQQRDTLEAAYKKIDGFNRSSRALSGFYNWTHSHRQLLPDGCNLAKEVTLTASQVEESCTFADAVGRFIPFIVPTDAKRRTKSGHFFLHPHSGAIFSVGFETDSWSRELRRDLSQGAARQAKAVKRVEDMRSAGQKEILRMLTGNNPSKPPAIAWLNKMCDTHLEFIKWYYGSAVPTWLKVEDEALARARKQLKHIIDRKMASYTPPAPAQPPATPPR